MTGSMTDQALSDPGEFWRELAAQVPDAWSPDGSTLLFEVTDDRARTLWQLRAGDGTTTRVADLETPIRFAFDATFSPDGRWFAYPAPGRTAVVVDSFPPSGSTYLLEQRFHPVWARDGNTLWSRDWRTSEFVATQVFTTTPAFAFGASQSLPFQPRVRPSRSTRRSHDMMADGRIIDVVPAEGADADKAPQINVVLHWLDEVTRLVPRSSQ